MLRTNKDRLQSTVERTGKDHEPNAQQYNDANNTPDQNCALTSHGQPFASIRILIGLRLLSLRLDPFLYRFYQLLVPLGRKQRAQSRDVGCGSPRPRSATFARHSRQTFACSVFIRVHPWLIISVATCRAGPS